MINDPFAGRASRAPGESRMLVATEDGVFLWPGEALVKRHGEGFLALDVRELNSRIGCLFGPDALDLPLHSVLEAARDHLRHGRVATVQRSLDRLRLPPISPNGWQSMRAIGRLHDVPTSRSRLPGTRTDLARGWDSSKHPRWPSGQSDGGEFRPADAASEDTGSLLRPVSDKKPLGGGPDNEPPLGDPPKIPRKEPVFAKEANDIRKAVARWLSRAILLSEEAVAPEIVLSIELAVHVATWLAPYVSSYVDGPKSLEALRAAVADPEEGYNIHHVVEQKAATIAHFPESQIEGPENLVRIPTIKHWEITGWFQRPNKEFKGLSPRQYLASKSWDERMRVGREALIKFGVLKP